MLRWLSSLSLSQILMSTSRFLLVTVSNCELDAAINAPRICGLTHGHGASLLLAGVAGSIVQIAMIASFGLCGFVRPPVLQ